MRSYLFCIETINEYPVIHTQISLIYVNSYIDSLVNKQNNSFDKSEIDHR